jgi:hypothetical protein
MKNAVACMALACLVLAAGCATETVYAPIEKASTVIPAKAAVLVRSDLAVKFDKEKDRCSVPVDRAEAHKMLGDPLSETGLFKKLAFLETPEDLDGMGADFLVTIDVTRHDISYKGRTGWFYPNLGIWFFTWVGAWWVPDEIFQGQAVVDVDVTDARTKKSLFRESFSAEAVRHLNDFERGWTVLSIINTSFEAANFKDAAAHVDVELWKKLQPAVLGGLAKELPRAIEASQWSPPRARRGVVVGVGHEGCVKDAGKVYDFLLKTAGYRKENVDLITLKTTGKGGGEDAHGRILDVLERLKGLDFPERDTVFFYFAGSGTVAPDGLPAVAASAGREKLLGIQEILSALENFRNSAVVVDAGFSPKGGGRSLASPGEAIPQAFSDILSNSPTTVFLAANPGQETLEEAEKGPGVFTRLLLDGLAGTADRNRDKKIMYEEISDYVTSQFKGFAAMLGKELKPVIQSKSRWLPGLFVPKPKKPVKKAPPSEKPEKKPEEKAGGEKKPGEKATDEGKSEPGKTPGEKSPDEGKSEPGKTPGEKAPGEGKAEPGKEPGEKAPVEGRTQPGKAPEEKPAGKGGDEKPPEKPADGKKASEKPADEKKPEEKAPEKKPSDEKK